MSISGSSRRGVRSSVPRLITLTTDFGLSDGYVAAMKGVILTINPRASIIDVTHEIPPQAITSAVFITSTVWHLFPAGTIHVCVVDPGVGTSQKALALRTAHGIFVGPDNGVLSAALPNAVREGAPEGGGMVHLRPGAGAFELTNPAYQRPEVSRTFHGRDVFAPAAAHLALGARLEDFGPRAERIVALPPFRAQREADGVLRARVIHVDRYGNLITDARAEDLPSDGFVVEIAGRSIRGPTATFGAGEGLLGVVGSYGYLGVALRDGSAARELGAGVGAGVVVRPA